MHFELPSPRPRSSFWRFFLGAISMPSSTSGSKSKAMTYAKALAAICAALILMFELASIYLLNHRSATYARILRHYDEAMMLRPAIVGVLHSVRDDYNKLLLNGTYGTAPNTLL